MIQFESLYNILNDWDKLHHAIAFDEWVANQDRNLGNVIIGINNSVTLIDHSSLPVHLTWTPEMLDIALEPRNILSDVFREIPTLQQKMGILEGASHQQLSLNLIKEELMHWANKMLNNEQIEKLTTFLECRAEFSHDRLSKKYGVLALAGVA
ncbi:hypothetical protein SOASR030_14250 [Leminorella grimontii]|uniref:Uncharacterized protein n=1 Tax=Leminorella grimontii TaxID=82981 RepID=A0AAV5N333_9GAMM|nr:hypothetical protein [Leminorella grimontii]GKX55313.1 hypothetical protein SOASR030_14250 [Leminorella grimontii]